METIFLINLIIVCICIILFIIIFFISLPSKEKESKNSKSINNYLKDIYHNGIDLVNIDNLNFLWDTLPDSLKKKYKQSDNLSLKWPPEKNERFRLTAFPYPAKPKSNIELVNFVRGMASLLNNTKNSVTFPGWQKSIYDIKNPDNNFIKQGLDNDKTILKTDEYYLEVMHSCYIPPNYDYPTCDDGGYWLYLATGSGIFWSTGKRYIVGNNKIDCLYKMIHYGYSHNKDLIINLFKSKQITISKDLKSINDDIITDFLSTFLKNTGGGYSLIDAMQTVIDDLQHHKKIIKITAFRNMEKGYAKPWYFAFLVYTGFYIGIIISSLILIIYLFSKKINIVNFSILISLLVLIYVMYIIFKNIFSEKMLEGFGYITLDMALKKSNLKLNTFILKSRTGKDLLPNSLAMIQNYDILLENLASICGLDSVIMHTQPNKSGTWACEIMDVRNTPFNPDPDKLFYKLGLCGNPVESNEKSKMPKFMKGPLISPNPSKKLWGYYPSKICNCNETKVKNNYKKNDINTLKKCTFCEGEISDKLC